MATTSLQPIQDKLALAKDTYVKAKKAMDDAIAIRDEYQRQVNVHLGNGDQANANIVSATYLAPANVQVDITVAAFKKAKADFDAVTLELQNAIANLSPTEKTAYLNESQAALNDSQAALAKANYAAVNKKYIITGIVVVVIVIGTLIYLKLRKKRAA